MFQPDESAENQNKSLRAEGKAKFEHAYFQAFWDEARELLVNRQLGLLSFDEIKDRLRLSDSTYRGLQDIPVDKIVGSVGRYRDFTRHFMPKKMNMAERWSNVYAQMNGMEGVPPIDVFQVDDCYFVRDGNHRVSIARQMGFDTIEAYVTEMHTPIDLEPNMTPKMLDAAAAYAHFLEKTRLNMTRPQQEQITLTEPGQYRDLLDHIRMVQNLMHRNGEPTDTPQAASRWYDTVYAPCVALVRKYNLLAQFPNRTEADLYVWVIRHFERLLDAYDDDVNRVHLSDAVVAFLAEHHLAVPKSLLKNEDPPIVAPKPDDPTG